MNPMDLALQFVVAISAAAGIVATHRLVQAELCRFYFPISAILGEEGGNLTSRQLLGKLAVPFLWGIIVGSVTEQLGFGETGAVVAGFSAFLAGAYVTAPNVLLPALIEETELGMKRRVLYFLYALSVLAFSVLAFAGGLLGEHLLAVVGWLFKLSGGPSGSVYQVFEPVMPAVIRALVLIVLTILFFWKPLKRLGLMETEAANEQVDLFLEEESFEDYGANGKRDGTT